MTIVSCDEYTLTGSITIYNEGDHIPERISVSALILNPQQQKTSWDKHKNIKLTRMADGSHQAQYKLKVKWSSYDAPPKFWRTSKIWNADFLMEVKFVKACCAEHWQIRWYTIVLIWPRDHVECL